MTNKKCSADERYDATAQRWPRVVCLPGDGKVYIGLGCHQELQERFQAPGDFAQAYVIAHEAGHHVQHLLGISDKLHAEQRRLGRNGAQANARVVRLELQADCLAGVWAARA